MVETTNVLLSSSEEGSTGFKDDWINASDIRANWMCIRAVLRYWFMNEEYGSDIPTLQKRLWMISQQNVALRNAVDKDIFEKFGGLLCQLSSLSDHRSINGESLESSPYCHSLLWNQWCVEESTLYGWEGKLAAIVVLDQFSRHIHRYLQNSPIQHHLPGQTVLDYLAFETSQLLLEQHPNEFHSAALITLPMRIFALMPFRHQSTLSTMQSTQTMIESVLSPQHEQCASMIQAFRKATNRRLAVLQDEARRLGYPANNCTMDVITDDDILECGYFIPSDPVTAPSAHVVYETIRSFVEQYLGIGPSRSDKAESVFSKDPTMLVSQETLRSVIVSLSGGVDSMVICAVLSHLQHHCREFSQLRIAAVHIDYANRPESLAEALYVQKYCQECLGNVDYHCRRIDEVTRGVTSRDDYERIAREIRYQFYRDTIQIYSDDTNRAPVSRSRGHRIDATWMNSRVGVMLGHHRGDLRENVLSNAHKGCGPLDLSGMTSVSLNDGVLLLRPLLPLEKSAVFDYAHAFGVPYFKDTTPHWSTRGKLRNKLLPLLEEIYGEGSMNNLSNLAVESDACRGLLHNVMIQPFLDRVEYKPMGLSFPTDPWKDQGLYFWKLVLREALHSAGLGMFTEKSVESFMKRVCEKVKEGWLQCRKDCGVFLRGDGYVYIFYPGSFPWGNSASVKSKVLDWSSSHLSALTRGDENTAQIGPWTISTKLYSNLNSEEARLNLDRKPFTSIDEFMEGSFEYWLVATALRDPKEPFSLIPQLCFTSFVKQTRPQAWKGIDPKIQDALPLLGPFESQQGEVEGRCWLSCVKRTTGCDSKDVDFCASRCYVKVTFFLTHSRIHVSAKC